MNNKQSTPRYTIRFTGETYGYMSSVIKVYSTHVSVWGVGNKLLDVFKIDKDGVLSFTAGSSDLIHMNQVEDAITESGYFK